MIIPETVQFWCVPVIVQYCNPAPHLSCGACCGLYDFLDNSKEHLEQILLRRTAKFWKAIESCKSEQDLWKRVIEIGKEINLEEARLILNRYDPPCAYMGVIGKEPFKVGCLLHPQQHNGNELRWFSDLSQPGCAGYSCDRYGNLGLAKIAMQSRDWYDYGKVFANRIFKKNVA